MQLSLAYPWYFILACLALGLLFAWFTYGFSSPFSSKRRILLGTFRFLAVSLLAFLLLEPVLRRHQNLKDQPALIVLTDASASMALHPQSGAYKIWLKDSLPNWLNAKRKDYKTFWVAFDDQTRTVDAAPELNGAHSNISSALQELNLRFANQQVAGVLLVSDGILNQGDDPGYLAQSFPFPIYTMPLGDTTRFADARIASLRHNEMAYLGNTFPLEVRLEADQMAGTSLELKLRKGNELLQTQTWVVPGNRASALLTFQVEAKPVGLQRFSLELKAPDNDKLPTNNREDFVVEIIDNRQKILLVGASAHPDLGAIRLALGTSADLDVETTTINQVDPTNLKSYSLVVLHNLPGNNLLWLPKLKEFKVPVWFILGSQSNLNAFNALGSFCTVQGRNQTPDEVSGVLSPGFHAFQAEPGFTPTDWPPLLSPYGNYQTSPATQFFLTKKIGQVITNQPLWAFAELDGWKQSLLAGEGLWRWRLHLFKNQSNFQAFDLTLRKMVQWLALREDKSRFRVRSKAKFAADEAIRFFAEAYDQALNPLPGQQIALEITHESGSNYSLFFLESQGAYRLDAGILPEGIYQWKAEWATQPKVQPKTGSFQVVSAKMETADLRTRLPLLQNLSSETGGTLLPFGNLNGFEQSVMLAGSNPVTLRKELKLDPLLETWWWFALVASLLFAEWILRKWFGRI